MVHAVPHWYLKVRLGFLLRNLEYWAAVKELFIPRGKPRLPLKGSVKGDIDIDIEVYHNMDM